MSSSNSDFIYFISETHHYKKNYALLGLTFVGAIHAHHKEVLLECLEKIKQSKAKYFIINFRNVFQVIDPHIISVFDHFLKVIRSRPSVIRLSGVHPALKQLFIDQGLVESFEIVNNLSEAIKSLSSL